MTTPSLHLDEPRILAEGRFARLLSHRGWEWVERTNTSAAVVIVAITQQRQLVLVEQYRIPLGRRVIELPAGLVGDLAENKQEDLMEAARRELLEETGYEAAGIEYLIRRPQFRRPGERSLHAVAGPRCPQGRSRRRRRDRRHPSPHRAARRSRSWLESKRREGLMVSPKIYSGVVLCHETVLRREFRVGVELLGESGQQVGGAVDVVQRNHLDRAVHVAVGNADQSRGHAGAADLDGVGVGAGGFRRGGQLIGDLAAVGGLDRAARRPWGSCSVRDGSPGRGRDARRPLPSSRPSGNRWHGVTSTATPTCGLTPKVLVWAPRRPISSCTVETAYRPQVSLPLWHARRRASMTTQQPALSSMAGETARLLRIVWKPSSTVMASPMRTAFAASSLLAAPMSSHRSLIFATCFRSSSVSRWIGFRAITPNTGPSAVQTVIRWPISICGIPAADRLHVNEAFVVDVLDDQPDLVAVAGEHDPQRGVGVFHHDDVAVQVGADFVGEILRVIAHEALHVAFIARGAGSFQKGCGENRGQWGPRRRPYVSG